MSTEKYEEELFQFLEQYADFLGQMAINEEEKLQALISNSLPRIERAISNAQADAKQMENYELKRQRLQEQAGYGGMTFSEMIDYAPEEEAQSLEALLWRIEDYVGTIKFHNSKSMKVARTNMLDLNPGAELPGAAAVNGVYQKVKDRTKANNASILETKI